MKTFSFALVVTGVDYSKEDFEDSFFEAGCTDALIALERGALVLYFDRVDEGWETAIRSAVRDIERAGGKPVRIEPDNLVTMAEIAKRSGLSRAAISLYVGKERGEAFPAPVARVLSDNPLWDWVQVAEWLFRQSKPSVTMDDLNAARAIKRQNEQIVRAGNNRQVGASVAATPLNKISDSYSVISATNPEASKTVVLR